MPLVTTTEMFKKAYAGGYAVGAFNVNNMEIVQGITEAAKEENAPLILFRADELAFLSAAGSEAVCMKRPVYDVRTLTGRTSESLADAFGAAFEFVPAMADAEDEALACGLLFCGLADRVLHLTVKR